MLQEPLTEKEISFMECWTDPTALTECLIPVNIKAPHFWKNKDCELVRVRNYQFGMQNYSYMYANDNTLSNKENFQNKKRAGDLVNIAARAIGKSFFLIIDAFLVLLHGIAGESCLASFDHKHLMKICKPVSLLANFHPFFQMFKRKGKSGVRFTGGGMEIDTMIGHTMYGKNEKVGEKDPGTDFHSLHYNWLGYDEACVDGKTQIRYVDRNGKIFADNIAHFVNEGLWKDNFIYSYNYKTKSVELKTVTNIFKKQVKNYKYWEIKTECFGNRPWRKLITSQKQKIWTKEGYKDVSELKENDELYSFDYFKLTQLQKEILVGTLLGDSSISLKKNGCNNPSLVFVQSKSQERYLKYKLFCFHNFFTSFHRRFDALDIKFKETSFGGLVGRLTSDTAPCLLEFVNFKKDKLSEDLLEKYLSPIGLAFWLMDDGHLMSNKGKTKKTKYLKLNTQGFNYESHLILQRILKNKFSLNAEIRDLNRFGKHYNFLFFNNTESLKLIDLIKDFVHPTLYYKIYNSIELCNFIYKNKGPEFINLSTDIQHLLQPVKILSIEEKLQRTWTMYDIEVVDNHNFFAGGVLISNSYMSKQGTEKRVDSIDPDVGSIEKISGIPDIRIDSPLGKILSEPKNKNIICRLPQYVMESWDNITRQEKIDLYNGESSYAFKLNVLGEIIEGASGFWDMPRLRKACRYGSSGTNVKFFEIDQKKYHKLDQVLIIDRLPCKQVFCCSDIGTTGSPSEIIIIFYDGEKYKYHYNIALYKLTTHEQAKVFAWIYERLGGAYIGLDCSNSDGRSIADDLRRDTTIPPDEIIEVKFNANIEVGILEDEVTGKPVKDNSGNVVMKEERTIDWAMTRLEKLFYGEEMEIPIQEKFISSFSDFIVKQTGMRRTYGTLTGDDHLHQSMQVFAIAQFLNEFRQQIAKPRKKRCYGTFSNEE